MKTLTTKITRYFVGLANLIMKEHFFCRCCLSENCYKDMTNTYYIGSKTENYFEMLWNIFNINIIYDDAERCLICEECVSKLRDAAAFKKKVLDIKEIIKNNICWNNNGTDIDTKGEDEEADSFDTFDDNVSDKKFIWENFTQDGSQKAVLLEKKRRCIKDSYSNNK